MKPRERGPVHEIRHKIRLIWCGGFWSSSLQVRVIQPPPLGSSPPVSAPTVGEYRWVRLRRVPFSAACTAFRTYGGMGENLRKLDLGPALERRTMPWYPHSITRPVRLQRSGVINGTPFLCRGVERADGLSKIQDQEMHPPSGVYLAGQYAALCRIIQAWSWKSITFMDRTMMFQDQL